MTNIDSSSRGAASEWRPGRGLLDANECCAKGRLPDAPELCHGAGGYMGSLDKLRVHELQGVGG